MKARKTVTVMKNSYVMLNRHHFSVPKEYIGKRVDIVYDADSLQIYHGLKLVTSHMRNDTPYVYTQKEAHKLPGWHGSCEKDLGEIYERAGAIDNILLNYLREVATQKKYLPLAFRTCRGIMSLEKGGTTRLTSVSGRAPVQPCPPRGGMCLCLRGGGSTATTRCWRSSSAAMT